MIKTPAMHPSAARAKIAERGNLGFAGKAPAREAGFTPAAAEDGAASGCTPEAAEASSGRSFGAPADRGSGSEGGVVSALSKPQFGHLRALSEIFFPQLGQGISDITFDFLRHQNTRSDIFRII